MAVPLHICDFLVQLIRYPREDYKDRLKACALALTGEHPDALKLLQPFLGQAREMPIEDLEELYTRTFDINPLCCLEVGWQLHGDEYDRGAFLVEMRQLLQKCDLPESVELPDHLEHILALLGRISRKSAAELAEKAVLPAIAKMIDGLKEKGNPFEHVLMAIESVLKSNYKENREYQEPQRMGEFHA